MPRFALLIAFLSVFGLGQTACAQQRAEPLRGSIAVADDTEDPALARITGQQARDIALAQFPGARVDDVDLEEEDGFLVYEVDLRTDTEEIEVLVDAGDGSVLRVERARADRDRD